MSPTAEYVRKLREVLPAAFPEEIIYFQAADIVTQILNFGIPAQIDVRTVGYDRAKNLQNCPTNCGAGSLTFQASPTPISSRKSMARIFSSISTAAAPTEFGLTATRIANNLNVSLSSSEQVSPNFWTDPSNGIPYYFAVQTPEYRVNSMNALINTPVSRTARWPSPTTPCPGCSAMLLP